MIEYKVTVHDDHTEWRLNGILHREDGPAYEHSDGYKSWYLNGQRHREDGPAIEGSDGSKNWWINGECHREDGPAVEYPDGSKLWWLNGQEYTESEYKKEMLKRKTNCNGKVVEIDGKKYKLQEIQ